VELPLGATSGEANLRAVVFIDRASGWSWLAQVRQAVEVRQEN
jgi:hypothetical protein